MELKFQTDGKVVVTYNTTHIGHDTNSKSSLLKLRIQDRDKHFIRDKYRQGVSKKRILRDVHEREGRSSLIRSRDINNIINDIVHEESKFHNNDPLSVDCHVKRLGKQVLTYQCQTENDKDFNLVILFKECKNHLLDILHKENGHKLYFSMDSTHGISRGKFKLITLLNLTDTGGCVPVLFCISTRETYEVVVNMLECLKREVGDIHADVFMSDDAFSFRKAWVFVFGEAKIFLLCQWHVKTAVLKKIDSCVTVPDDMKEKVSPSKMKEIVSSMFLHLLDVESEEDFLAMFDNFQFFIETHELNDFRKYFNYEYLEKPDIAPRHEMWPQCFRQEIRLTTNNHLERMHYEYKHIIMEGNRIKRLDKAIVGLHDLTRTKFDTKDYIEASGANSTLHKKGYYQRCRDGLELKVEPMGSGKYQVSTENKTPHLVSFRKDCKCRNKCLQCDICEHSYMCDCMDYRRNVCKHLHAVGTTIFLRNNERDFVSDETCNEEQSEMLEKTVSKNNKKDELRKLSEEAQDYLTQMSGYFTEPSKYTVQKVRQILIHLRRAVTLVKESDGDMCSKQFTTLLPESNQSEDHTNTAWNKDIPVVLQKRFIPKGNNKTAEEINKDRKNKQEQHEQCRVFLHDLPMKGKPMPTIVENRLDTGKLCSTDENSITLSSTKSNSYKERHQSQCVTDRNLMVEENQSKKKETNPFIRKDLSMVPEIESEEHEVYTDILN
ncbi:unnamed protein product, partial [Meganyctiphanes norvegica]